MNFKVICGTNFHLNRNILNIDRKPIIIKVSKEISLSQIVAGDKEKLTLYLNDRDIYMNTLRLPHPYTLRDAEWWIHFVERCKKQIGRLNHFAIRDKSENLIGGIGFNNKYGKNSQRDEIGYWLARPFWNRGIMTETVNKICEFGFDCYDFLSIEAIVFDFNAASARVLEKNGFQKDGIIKKYALKDDCYIDGICYSLNKKS